MIAMRQQGNSLQVTNGLLICVPHYLLPVIVCLFLLCALAGAHIEHRCVGLDAYSMAHRFFLRQQWARAWSVRWSGLFTVQQNLTLRQ